MIANDIASLSELQRISERWWFYDLMSRRQARDSASGSGGQPGASAPALQHEDFGAAPVQEGT